MKNRCQLCGGKLENNRCVLCGLDNSQNDSRYITNEAHTKNSPLTHVHKDSENPFRGKTITKEQRRLYREAKQKTTKNKNENNLFDYTGKRKSGFKTKKHGKSFVGGIVKVIAVVVAINFVLTFIANIGFGGVWDELYPQEEVNDPYQDTAYEIPAEGEYYSVELTGGIYVGGYNIPEGNYRIESIENDGTLELSDDYHSIYLVTDLYDDTYADDLRVYNGTTVRVNDGMKVLLSTDNAQPLLDEGFSNTLTESFELDGEYVAGQDFPAGVYDVVVIEGNGNFVFEKNSYESIIEDYIWLEESDSGSRFSNVVLQGGMNVRTEDVKVRLEPSRTIYSVDYNEFYNN